MEIHLGVQVGSLVAMAASFMYYGFRRSGERGFARFCTFWMGFPVTWFIAMFVPAAPRPRPIPDNDGELLAEIRRDRAERLIAERASPEASDHEADAPV